MTDAPHPLDPLTPDEVRAAVAILRRERGLSDRWRFASIDLHEPAKDTLGDGEPSPPPREAEIVGWDRDDGAAVTAVVSLSDDGVVSWERHEGEQAPMTGDEFHEAEALLHADPEIVRVLAERGITDLDNVLFDVWAYGAFLVPDRFGGRRVGWADVWVRDETEANPYANPVPGLHPILDLNAMELLEIEDERAVERAEVMGEYLPRLVPGMRERTDIQPLEITQPQGPSFALDGRLLEWQKWSMRIGFTAREGLVLHAVGYRDGDVLRPVAHRMSFAEMVVPYRDPTPDHARRTAFDIGEWGLGNMTTSLALGCDCKGEISYLDAVITDSHGEPSTIENAICIHEEDDGILWKHVDDRAGAESRRMRRLVVSFHATVANYEYLVYWRFHQDGAIQCEVRATGIMITTPFSGEQPPYGVLVDERTYAPIHQHFITVRLDLDIDGEANTVYTSELAPGPASAQDAHGLGLVSRSTPLRTEHEGRQDVDWGRQRAWKVVNESVVNGLGTPVGYKLVPGDAIPALLPPDSPVLNRSRVIDHQLWVTPYRRDERWPAGAFPNLSNTDHGLPEWTAADRPIENTDVVLWYTFGIAHVPRPEDWPVMPVDTISFWLKPVGFFSRNPALDVPAEPGHHC